MQAVISFKVLFNFMPRHGTSIIQQFNTLYLTALAAHEDGVAVFKNKAWRRKGQPIPEVLEAYQSVGAELNVLPFCSQFIPMDVINHPQHKSICYHPSLLPLHRGASAINWYDNVP